MKKKRIIIISIIALIILLVVVPVIINETYKSNQGYVTLWEAKDVLIFYGSILSLMGTIFLGFIAIKQNERLIKIETKKTVPFLSVEKIDLCINKKCNDITITLNNTTPNIIKIIDLENNKMSINRKSLNPVDINFIIDWSKLYTFFPNSKIELNYFNEYKFNSNSLFAPYQKPMEVKLDFVICNLNNENLKYIETILFEIEKDSREEDKFIANIISADIKESEI